MNYTMARVQVYLNPQDVDILDIVAEKINIKRSQVIRDAIKSIALRYSQVAAILAGTTVKKNPLLDLVGAFTSKNGKIGLNVDEIYLND